MTEEDVKARVERACAMSGTPKDEAKKLADDFARALTSMRAPVETIVLCSVCFDQRCNGQHYDERKR